MSLYINNDEFERNLKEYLETKSKESEDRLIKNFDILIDHILYSFNFKIDYDDAKQDCFVLVLKILRNFNPENGKAFNYFTTVIINNLRLIYTKNKIYDKKISDYITKLQRSSDVGKFDSDI